MPARNRLLEIRLQLASQLKRDISQREMAELVGTSQPQYSKYEKNKEQPQLDTVFRILKKLGKQFDEVFYWQDEDESGL